jgi:hypothetical protein
VFTGVIPDPLNVAVWATLDMSTERSGPAELESRDSFELWQRDPVLSLEDGKVVSQ